ncbi:DNA polymerase II [Chitinispirillales bacterium ANBcel5]|uniref:DNA polymerase II n=1 Tax=Cellulosispirillum alkaliphilum TaxID=3039283 RepID=UPI002A57378D|nr:DNA polymerase II [Chitinispirillales bacterium ANBcel5]
MNSGIIKTLDCFLLTAHSRDYNNHFEITLWGISSCGAPIKILIDCHRPLFFIPSSVQQSHVPYPCDRKSLQLKSLKGEYVDCLYFSTHFGKITAARQLRTQGIRVYETDIHPLDRYLMERNVKGGMRVHGEMQKHGNTLYFKNPHLRGCNTKPQFKILSIDIETCVKSGEIYSIACYSPSDSVVFMRGAEQNTGDVLFLKNEKELLVHFFSYLRKIDPDIIIGWNVVEFDLKMIAKRSHALSVPFEPGRESGSKITQSQKSGLWSARIPGRVVIDVPMILRSYYHNFEEYSLDHVAKTLLGRGKTISLTSVEKIEEIDRLFQTDKLKLSEYNLTDALLTYEIFTQTDILPNAVERSKRSGQLLNRAGGAIASFDYLYLPKLHRAGFVVNDTLDITPPTEPLPGGYVLEPVPGFYDNVLVLDFRSLYPSIIMSFFIDPLGFNFGHTDGVKNPYGTTFSATHTILPKIISELMEARQRAKEENNPHLSQAIKILMNSFYGILGSPGCRFFSQHIAKSITVTGRYLLEQTIKHIETTTSHKVIYGDTDSLFIHLGQSMESEAKEQGENIARETTEWLSAYIKETFKTESALKLQFENHFRYFFMPAMRGSTQGSKKHYCGALSDKNGSIKQLIFKGMESARSDWTELAKEFQHELLFRVFSKQPVEQYITSVVLKLKKGMMDEKLVYKKRLRKSVEEYTVNIPPHVQAAKLLTAPKNLVRYVITQKGPQPIENQTSPIDYQHYLNCQLKPVAESVLERLNCSFEDIISGQQDLFA